MVRARLATEVPSFSYYISLSIDDDGQIMRSSVAYLSTLWRRAAYTLTSPSSRHSETSVHAEILGCRSRLKQTLRVIDDELN